MEQFNLEKWLQDKSRKVVTRDGREAKIVYTDGPIQSPIVAIVSFPVGLIKTILYDKNGIAFFDDEERREHLDLFFADEDEELTEFEKAMQEYYFPEIDDSELKRFAKGILDLARKELQQEFDKEMDKLLAETDKVVYQKGQQDALKDLPKWKKATENKEFDKHVLLFEDEERVVLTTELYKGEYYIELDELKTLPKEE